MTELDEYRQNIQVNLKNLEELINKSGLFNSDRSKWETQIQSQIKQANKGIKLLEQDIRGLHDSEAKNYVGSIKSFKTKIKKLEADKEKRIRGDSFLGIKTNTPIIKTAEEKNESARQMLFDRGDQALQATKDATTQMKRMAQEGIQKANEINLTLAGQIEQLDRMHGTVKDTESTLKKAQKNITYFAKALECDKCMVGLLALILLALVAVIVLAVKRAKEN